MEIKNKYAIGDKAWIYLSHHNGELTEGKVVHVFSLPGWCIQEHYVIEVDTSVDPLLEVRSTLSMSDTPEGPIGFWRRVAQ